MTLRGLLERIIGHLHRWEYFTEVMELEDGRVLWVDHMRECACGETQERLVTGAPGVGIEEMWVTV